MLNIIMYHYVRNNEDYSYDCYARRWSEFESQIDLMTSKLEVISPGDLEKIRYYLDRDDQSACLLTFDDGYKDHFACSEFLKSKSLSAIFFPPMNILKGKFLDVNAIHFLIGQRNLDIGQLLSNIVSQIKEKKLYIASWEGTIISIDEYLTQTSNSNRFDDNATVYVKRLLQRDIVGDECRSAVILECIDCFSNSRTTDLTKEMYLSIEEMQRMHSDGMYFGSHGLTHRWLSRLSREEQQIEIVDSFTQLKQLKLLDINQDPKVMCYPFGDYNSDTINILEDQGVDYSLTTKVGAAIHSPASAKVHELKRWDTNDFWDKKWQKPVIPLCEAD